MSLYLFSFCLFPVHYQWGHTFYFQDQLKCSKIQTDQYWLFKTWNGGRFKIFNCGIHLSWYRKKGFKAKLHSSANWLTLLSVISESNKWKELSTCSSTISITYFHYQISHFSLILCQNGGVHLCAIIGQQNYTMTSKMVVDREFKIENVVTCLKWYVIFQECRSDEWKVI